MNPSNNTKQIILIVDDTPINIQLLFQVLSKEYDVRIATSGAKALEIASSVMPDLILLDIMMPEMDGYAVCKQLKSDPHTAGIPIIFITAKDEVADESKGFSLGAVDYIRKPFNLSIVQMRAQTHLLLRKQAKLLEEYAFLDPLTLIPNRRKFELDFEEEWRRALRSEQPLSLCMLDIDFFKGYNDSLGHGEGDVCLQKVATAINGHYLRGGELAARYGGEEFIVLLPNCDEEAARKSAEHMCKVIEEMQISHPTSTVSPYVTVSIGYATVHPKDKKVDMKSLSKLADDGLYYAKEHGRNQAAAV